MGEHTGRAARPRAGRLALLLGLVLVVAAGVAVYARVDRGSDGTARPAGPDPCSRQPIALNVGAETSAMSWLAPPPDVRWTAGA
jgi:hypothetical protein